MDPAVGRRWIPYEHFAEEIYRHEISVSATDWRGWAASDDFLNPLRARLAKLGGWNGISDVMVHQGLRQPGWFGLAALDASTRLVTSIVKAGGVRAGKQAIPRPIGPSCPTLRTWTKPASN